MPNMDGNFFPPQEVEEVFGVQRQQGDGVGVGGSVAVLSRCKLRCVK